MVRRWSPCDLETFGDLLIGNDNHGDGGIGVLNEPGNQLAGVDFRWSAASIGLPVAVYGQFIGEDEAGGFPSRYLGQLGFEGSRLWRGRWSYRWFTEIADTSCGFYDFNDRFNRAYNHSIYRSGYRRSGMASTMTRELFRQGSCSSTRTIPSGESSRVRAISNRGGAPDPGNSLTATSRELASVDLIHARATGYGVVEIGAGIERNDDVASAGSDDDARAWFRWRSPY